MLELRIARESLRNLLTITLVDDQGMGYKGQERYARTAVSDDEMVNAIGGPKRVCIEHIMRLVEEFNHYGKKVKIVELAFTKDSDIPRMLPLFDLGIALMYWSDSEG